MYSSVLRIISLCICFDEGVEKEGIITLGSGFWGENDRGSIVNGIEMRGNVGELGED